MNKLENIATNCRPVDLDPACPEEIRNAAELHNKQLANLRKQIADAQNQSETIIDEALAGETGSAAKVRTLRDFQVDLMARLRGLLEDKRGLAAPLSEFYKAEAGAAYQAWLSHGETLKEKLHKAGVQNEDHILAAIREDKEYIKLDQEQSWSQARARLEPFTPKDSNLLDQLGSLIREALSV